jgi:dienelactone hydrolase
MKKLITLILSIYCFSVSAQPFSIGSTTITFNDPSRSNRAIETDIYYPASTAGSNAPVAAGQFPVIVFGHGFVMTVSAYQNIWSALVPQGYIVALPKTEGNLFPNHTNFGRDIAFVVSQIQASGAQSSGLFAGRVAATSCVMGHSMGGGASFLSVQYNSSITAIATLAPAETNPAASAAAQNVTIPALVFAGANDCVTPAAQHSLLIYNATASSCKSYISITGGSHCQFANSNFNCSFGESTCSPGPTISRTTQQNKVMEYLIPWLNFRLKNQCQSWFNLQAQLSSDATVSAQQSCNAPVVCSSPGNRQARNITTSSARLSWNAFDCAASYEVRFRRLGTTAWTIRNAAQNNFLVVNGLLSSTAYEWQIRRRCDANGTLNSVWGPIKQFTTAGLRMGEQTLTDEKNAVDFSVIPNPNKGLFTLELESLNGSSPLISIYNTLGSIVEERKIETIENETEQLSFNLNHLPSGIYFIRITGNSGQLTKRFVIE